MKLVNKIKLGAIAAAFFGMFMAGEAQAALSDNMDIHVSINGNKSVLVVGTTSYDYGALDVNTSSVSASSFTIRNDSTVFIETYTLTGANAISDSGGTDWTLNSSAAADQYALAAQFSDNAPADLDGSWASDDLTTGAQTCSTTAFGNGTEAEAGSNVAVSADRGLWFRIKTPTSVTDSGAHTVTVTVSVL